MIGVTACEKKTLSMPHAGITPRCRSFLFCTERSKNDERPPA